MNSFDVIVRGGSVIDGRGAPARRADVGIRGDRIAAIDALEAATAAQIVDASDCVVAPGFIDVHNHSDGWLVQHGHLAYKTRQGFTTEVLMSDGISYAPVSPETAPHWLYYLRALNGLTLADYRDWQSLDDFFALLATDSGRCAQNVAVQVPYANVRTLAMGWGRHEPDDAQLRHIQSEIAHGMELGCVGLSTGLDYVSQCFASTAELTSACKAMAARRGLYVTHVRYKLGMLAALDEAADIAERADVPLHVSHLKCDKPEEAEPLLAAIDRVASRVDFSFDCYPYVPGSSMLHMLLPYEVWEDGPLAVLPKLARPEIRRRVAASFAAGRNSPDAIRLAWLPSAANREYLGGTLAQYAQSTGRPIADAVCELLIDENLAVLVVFHRGEDPHVAPFLAHAKYMLGSDGIYAADGRVHPRVCGSAPRLLGHFVRERKLFALEEAVRKMTSWPAERFGLVDRGVLRAGAFADVVVFRADVVADRATYAAPYEPPVGIEHVLVNGQAVIADGEPVALARRDFPGRVLRYRS